VDKDKIIELTLMLEELSDMCSDVALSLREFYLSQIQKEEDGDE